MTKQEPEGQDWQTTCRVCQRQRCPKVEKVAEWMRMATRRGFEGMDLLASETPQVQTWRDQTAYFSSSLEQMLTSWSRCLEGVCYECQAKTFPEEDARLGNPEALHAEHWRRWVFAVPLKQTQADRDAIREEVLKEVASFGDAGAAITQALTPPATLRVIGKDGPIDAPCAWSRGGLAVVKLDEVPLAKAKVDRDAGNREAYPLECWAVVHVQSSTNIVGPYDVADGAVEVGRRLLTLGDWTRSVEELKVDGKVMAEVRMETYRVRYF